MAEPPRLPAPAAPASDAASDGGARYIVRCGMAGASGVVGAAQLQCDGPEYAFGRRMLMADLRALLEGLRQGGAREVLVYDAHADGRNVDPAELPPFATLISGRPAYRPDWAGGLDSTCAGLILLAAHAGAGAPGALLPCTLDAAIEGLRLNGQEMGEIGVEAAVAGDWGVPLLMVTGDSAAVAEACTVSPEVLGVVVKDPLGPQAALCYPLSVTTDLIRRAAEHLAKETRRPRPFRVEDPVTLEASLTPGPLLDRLRELYPRDLKSEKKVRLKGHTATEVWAGLQARWMRAVRRA